MNPSGVLLLNNAPVHHRLAIIWILEEDNIVAVEGLSEDPQDRDSQPLVSSGIGWVGEERTQACHHAAYVSDSRHSGGKTSPDVALDRVGEEVVQVEMSDPPAEFRKEAQIMERIHASVVDAHGMEFRTRRSDPGLHCRIRRSESNHLVTQVVDGLDQGAPKIDERIGVGGK
jgi:hypothetical protein